MKKWIIPLVSIVMVFWFVINLGYAQQVKPKVINWTMQTSYPPAPWTEDAGGFAELFSDFMKKVTNGRLMIKVIPIGGLVKVPDVLTAVSKGTLDAAGLHYAGFHTGVMPEANIEVGLPYAWQDNREALDAYLNYGLLEKFRKIYAERNIFWTPSFLGCNYALNTNFPISSPYDLKGKKIRALGPYADWIKKFGGAPTVIPVSEVYMALKLGTIDGTINSGTLLTTAKLEEVVKYSVISPNFNTIVCNCYINMDSLKALPDDIRTLVENATLFVLTTTSLAGNVGEEKSYRRAVEKYGLKLVTFEGKNREIAMSAGFALWDQMAEKSPRCAELVSIVKKQMKDYGKIK